MDSLSWKIFLGLTIFFGITLIALFFYGIISKKIEGSNFYLFQSSSGDIIVGSLAIVAGIFTLAVGIWYFISHEEDFKREHLRIHKDMADQSNEADIGYLMGQVQKELRLKNVNILIIFVLFSFFFTFMGISSFLNEENIPSVYQAYERPCPKNTLSAEAQKHPNDLI
tara:strand:+ start:2507 stop:3010 length:504 start_codon:yes stop_codon:yes gene_type:complete